ncbi:lysostaphin resistance A-like protein [Staphylococcus succinus]|uniref:CPBP family intramembrane glutamic endopeptidase n=1 Tax=Staphylococcus succinus TaxID=61015 RepID=UPI0039FD3FB7
MSVLSISTTLSFVFNAILFSIILYKNEYFNLAILLSLFVSLLVLPLYIYRNCDFEIKVFRNNINVFFGIRLLVYIIILTYIYQNFWLFSSMIIVAISEEYLYRKIIFNRLLKYFNFFISTTISSILFAFILHNAENFIVNIALRLTLGFLFCWVTFKTKDIKDSVFLHLIYNLSI